MGRDILLSTNSHIFEINVRDNLYQAKQGLNLKRNETIQLSVPGLHNYTFAEPFKNDGRSDCKETAATLKGRPEVCHIVRLLRVSLAN
ncbi:hypothetical protein C8J43_104504 [Sphingomonas sp. PP-CE-1G-424]|jgi:hypothetical protein|nr:hypothetical protein C8J43_104504 [Sphingomonas sp. PP-CE-1G-424]